MTELCNYRRIANPYIQDVWIAALGSELKVANPDNSALKKLLVFFRICNPKEKSISICNARKETLDGLQILIFNLSGLQIQTTVH